MKKKILIVKCNTNDYISKIIKKRGYNIEPMYIGGGNKLKRFLRRLFLKYKLPFYKKWFNKKILNYDVEIVFFYDSLLSESLVEWVNDNMDVKIHVWYWNIVTNTIQPDKLNDEICSKWSFSSLDAKKYNMKFMAPYFFDEIKCDNENVEYDILFVGKDKGRLRKLLEYKETFTNMGFKCKFIITPTRGYHINKHYSKSISYEENFKMSCKTKVIFDYIGVNNSGQSMRVMEALFRQKKIITDNILIKNYDFYRKENIFILGEDDFRDLNKFVNSPYVELDSSIVKKYDFDNFILRFIEDEKENI